jgi:hypothetical protein
MNKFLIKKNMVADKEYKMRCIIWAILIILEIILIHIVVNMCLEVNKKIKQLEDDRIQINR